MSIAPAWSKVERGLYNLRIQRTHKFHVTTRKLIIGWGPATVGDRPMIFRRNSDGRFLHMHLISKENRAFSVKEMAHITDLPIDVFNKIIILVAKSPEGARDVARSLPTCKRLLEASNNVVVQRAVCFENVKILGRVHLFQRKNGLLNNCAKVCDPLAEHLLSQVILVTCTRLVIINMSKDRLNYFHHYIPKYESRSGKACEDCIAASFIAHFTHVPKNAEESDSTLNPRPLSFHWEFAKSFISNCTRGDIEDMAIHLHKGHGYSPT